MKRGNRAEQGGTFSNTNKNTHSSTLPCGKMPRLCERSRNTCSSPAAAASVLSVCVCSSALPLVKQTHTHMQLFIHPWHRMSGEERDGYSNITWSLRFYRILPSRPVHCYWLGATHPLPKGCG